MSQAVDDQVQMAPFTLGFHPVDVLNLCSHNRVESGARSDGTETETESESSLESELASETSVSSSSASAWVFAKGSSGGGLAEEASMSAGRGILVLGQMANKSSHVGCMEEFAARNCL